MKSIIKTKGIKIHKDLLLALLCIGISCIVLVTPYFLRLVEFLGHRITQDDIQLDYIKGLVWGVLLGFTIPFWPVRFQDKRAIILIWAVRCFVMLGPMLFYEYYYQTDSFGFFSQVKTANIGLLKAIRESPPHNLSLTFVLFMHKYSFFNSFHAAKVSFGMIGFVAIYIFYRSMVVFLRQEKLWLLYFFALFPSILFWSSILGKESLLLLGIAVYCYGAIKWIRSGSISFAIIALISAVFTASMRPWMGVILGIAIFIIATIIPVKNFKSRMFFLIAIAILILFFANQTLMVSSIGSFMDLPKIANMKFIHFTRGGSMTVKRVTAAPEVLTANLTPEEIAAGEKIGLTTNEIREFATIEGSGGKNRVRFKGPMEMIFYLPLGMFTALFRPLPGEVNNIFGILAGIEDALLLMLFALAIKRARWSELLDTVCIWAVTLITLWAAVYGFVAYNLGTVCRYRLQILPIFLGLLLFMAFGVNKPVTCNKK